MNLNLGGSVQDPFYRLAGPRPSYRPELCLFLCLSGFRFVVDFRCGISKSECFLGLGICNPESLSIAWPVLRCLASGIRATVSGPTRIP